MVIQLASDAPFLLKALTTTTLWLHIGGATLGMLFGSAALLVRKGRTAHRVTGTVFFGAMLAMAGVGAIAAPLVPVPDPVSSLAGAFTLYLVVTGWAAVKRPANGSVGFELGALAYILAVIAAGLLIARAGAASPSGQIGGQPYLIAVGLSSVAALGAILDLTVIWRRGIAGAQRIARHLWRMCLALFVALGSFAGQPKAQPEFLRGSPWLMAPALLVLVAMIYWLVRTLARRRPTAMTMEAAR